MEKNEKEGIPISNFHLSSGYTLLETRKKDVFLPGTRKNSIILKNSSKKWMKKVFQFLQTSNLEFWQSIPFTKISKKTMLLSLTLIKNKFMWIDGGVEMVHLLILHPKVGEKHGKNTWKNNLSKKEQQAYGMITVNMSLLMKGVLFVILMEKEEF